PCVTTLGTRRNLDRFTAAESFPVAESCGVAKPISITSPFSIAESVTRAVSLARARPHTDADILRLTESGQPGPKLHHRCRLGAGTSQAFFLQVQHADAGTRGFQRCAGGERKRPQRCRPRLDARVRKLYLSGERGPLLIHSDAHLAGSLNPDQAEKK